MTISCPYCLEDNDPLRHAEEGSIVCSACGATFAAPLAAQAAAVATPHKATPPRVPASSQSTNAQSSAGNRPPPDRRSPRPNADVFTLGQPETTEATPAGKTGAKTNSKATVETRTPEQQAAAQSSAAGVYQMGDVAADPTSPENYVLVVCKICGTRMHPRREYVGKKCKCPDCGTVNVIQPPPPPPPNKERAPVDIGAYGVTEGPTDESRFGTDQFFLVVCTTCGTRLHPRRDQAGKRIRCPDCQKIIRIPEAPPIKKSKTQEEIGQYGMSQGDVWDYSGTDQAADCFFEVFCPRCRTRMTPRRDDVGTRITCPDCRERFDVPLPPPIHAPREVPQPQPHKVSRPVENTAPPPREPVQPRAIEERIPIAPMPDSPFLSGTFAFPLRSDAIGRCAASALALTVVGGLLSAVTSSDNPFAQVFLSLPLSVCVMFSGSYLASCFLAIINETAEGADEISDWPEGFRDWIFGLLHVGYIVAITFSVAYGTEWAQVQITGQPGQWWPLVGFLLFPFLMLSSLESELPIMPFSRPILTSLWRSLGSWLKFYLLSGALLAAWLMLVLSLEPDYPTLAFLIAGPFWTAVTFIYARLLGRLAWNAAHGE